jgi:hypothetical protein
MIKHLSIIISCHLLMQRLIPASESSSSATSERIRMTHGKPMNLFLTIPLLKVTTLSRFLLLSWHLWSHKNHDMPNIQIKPTLGEIRVDFVVDPITTNPNVGDSYLLMARPHKIQF